MREVQLVIRDDLDGTPNAAGVTFAYQGDGYEIDLGPENLVKFEEALAPWIKAARPTSKGPRQKSRNPRSSDAARAKIEAGLPIPKYLQRTAELVQVRDWANANGRPVKDNGQVPKSIIEAYNHAHPDRPVQE